TVGGSGFFCEFVGITGTVDDNGSNPLVIDEIEVTLPTICTFAGILPAHVAAQTGDITLFNDTTGYAHEMYFDWLITGINRTCEFEGHTENGGVPLQWDTHHIVIGGEPNLKVV